MDKTEISEIKRGLDSGVESLLARQDDAGWWKGELQTNVSIEAEDLFMRQFLGINTPEILETTANWIRSQLRDDGTWSNFYNGTPELSTTTEAYVALRLAGDDTSAVHMKNIREFILDSGGLESTRVFTRIWMSIFGEWEYDKLPTLLPEIIHMPRWFPFNIYNFACWARQTIVPLTIMGAYRPVRRVLPFDLDELKTGEAPKERVPRSFFTKTGMLQRLDSIASVYNRVSIPPIRKYALKKAERWIVDRQEADGSWGGIQPPWVYSILALATLGHPLDHPVVKKALDCIDKYEIREGDTRRLECCQSPIWDTALAVVALADAGVAPDHPQLLKAGDWLLSKEVTTQGDWSEHRPHLDPGGWSFEFANENYPDIDDTAEVILALDRLEGMEGVSGPITRGLKWLEGMQCENGGYGAFDAENTNKFIELLPFCDFGAVIDPPTEDVTAHAIEMQARLYKNSVKKLDGDLAENSGENSAYEVDQNKMERAIDWLSTQQNPDGSWFGRWGNNYIYGAGAVVPALIDAGIPPDDKRIEASVEWLKKIQNADGGWGEDMRSYRDPEWIGRGETTPSQTAWAVMALLAAGELELASSGVKWLIENQRFDGTWDEPWYTGTGFPGDFYINYHLYRDIFPITAIGRYLSKLEPASKKGRNL